MRICACCGHVGGNYKENGMGHDECPKCGSYSRHRLMCLSISKLPPASKILHFAPEESVSQSVKQHLDPKVYIGADKSNNEGRKAGINIQPMSAEDIPFADDEFSGMIASHIMEHVDDDLKCIQSFRRVLQPKGWIMLLVPIFQHLLDGRAPNDFGQADHKRLYQPKELVHKMESNRFNCTSLYDFNKLSQNSAKMYHIHEHHVKFKNADILCFKSR